MNDAPKFDEGKLDLSLLPIEPLEELARVYEIGNDRKYPRESWRQGFKYNRIIAALMRHIFAWRKGQNNDPEDNLHHLAHAVWCCFTLYEMQRMKFGTDDRFFYKRKK